MPAVTSFLAEEKAEAVLKEIPWGKRSKFINECILCHVQDPKKDPPEPLGNEAMKEKLSKTSDNSSTSAKPLDTHKAKSEPAADTATKKKNGSFAQLLNTLRQSNKDGK